MPKVKTIRRRVIVGKRRGGKLGYPTANLPLNSEDKIKKGVWATVIKVKGEDYPSATFVGAPISFGSGPERIEVFIFNYEGNIYGQEVELSFVRWLRPVEKFAGEAELAGQIKKDCQQASKILGSN